MPSTVRDRIRSDSNSASEPKMWKTSRPPGGTRLDQVGQRPTQPVQAPHREGVPRAQCGHHLRELRPGPRRGVGPRPPAPRGAQRVVLQRRVLHRGRHPRVPQQLPHEQRQCHNPPKPPTLTRTFRSRVPQQQASPSTCGSKLRLRPPRPRVKNDRLCYTVVRLRTGQQGGLTGRAEARYYAKHVTDRPGSRNPERAWKPGMLPLRARRRTVP